MTALVRSEAGSEPASGSDSANAGLHSPLAQRGRKRSFCSSVPKSWIGSVPSSWTMRISADEAQALAISSTAICSISVPVPVPPYCSSNGSPRTSCSASSSRMSCGYCAVRSISAARGAIFSCASWRIMSRRSASSWGIAYASVVAVVTPLMVQAASGWAYDGARTGIYSAMGIGTSIFLIAARRDPEVRRNDIGSGIELATVGVILIVVGIIGLLFSLLILSRGDRGGGRHARPRRRARPVRLIVNPAADRQPRPPQRSGQMIGASGS